LRRGCLSIVRAVLVVMLLASVAHADAWTKSCPIPTHHGLCVRFARAAADACDPKRARWVRVARDPALVEKALSELPEQDAALARADLDFEKLVADPLPRLHLGRFEASQRSAGRFHSWLYRQMQRRETLVRRYSELRVEARIGEIAQVIASQLVTSKLPHGFTGRFAKERRDAYCDTMNETIEPLLASALQDFAACAGKEPANEWNAICVRELEEIDPATFPPMREKLPKPSVRGIEITLEGEPEE
jgi:hypothetical protein